MKMVDTFLFVLVFLISQIISALCTATKIRQQIAEVVACAQL